MSKRVLFRVALGQALRDERQAQGLTLRQVSGQASVALGYLSEVERGSKELSSELLDKVAYEGMGVEPSEIIYCASLIMGGIQIPDTAHDLLNRIENYSESVL